ncbi:phage major capsid protein [Cutibacterium avidum]|uniref:phage major capsid protein n=1 Tax=Cutibacterium avidum TaxID=33010 RepID=UPI002FF0C3C1
MAVTAPTKTTDFAGYLQPHMAQDFFTEAAKRSVVQQLARKVPLGISGETVPIVTSKPTAGWVAEAGEKPVTNGKVGLLKMEPKKIAAIAVVSSEVVRANPANYVNLFKTDIAEAFAVAFDAAVLHGTNSPFKHNLDETKKAVELGTADAAHGGIYGDANSAIQLMVADGKKLTGWAFDATAEPLLNGSYDTTGRPLLTEPVYSDSALASARLLGRSAFIGDSVATADKKTVVGYGGDWSKIVWGQVGGITYSVSTEATVKINGELIPLWQNNLVGILAEAEFGCLITDPEQFVKLTNAA